MPAFEVAPAPVKGAGAETPVNSVDGGELDISGDIGRNNDCNDTIVLVDSLPVPVQVPLPPGSSEEESRGYKEGHIGVNK